MKYKTASWALIAAALALSGALFAAEGNAGAEKDFADSFAAGHPLAAERAFQKLAENRVKLPAIRYWQAAEVSRQLGKEADRRTRLSHYIKVAGKFDDTVEQAAWELCRLNDDADAFVLLASKANADRALFGEAARLVETYRNRGRGPDVMKVVEASFRVFKSEEDRAKLARLYSEAAGRNATGQSDDEIRAYVAGHPVKDLSAFDYLFYNKGGMFTPMFKLRLMQSSGGLLSADILGRSINVEAKERAEAARISTGIAPLVLDGSHGRHAYQWLRLRLAVRAELFSKGQENEMSKAFFGDFCKVADSKDGYGTFEMMSLMLDVARGALQKPEMLALLERYPQYVHPEFAGPVFGLSERCKKAGSSRPYHDFAAKYSDRDALRYHMADDLAAVGDVAEVKLNMCAQMLFSERFNHSYLLNTACKCAKSDEELAKLLSEVAATTGWHKFWKWCVESPDAAKIPAMKGAQVKAVLAGLKEGFKSSNRLVEIRREMLSLGRASGNSAPEAAHKLFAEAAQAFKGRLPADGFDARLFRDAAVYYARLSRAHGGSAVRAARALKDKIDPRDAKTMNEVFHDELISNASSDVAMMCEIARASGDARYIKDVRLPKGTSSIPVSFEAFERLPEQSLMSFIGRNCRGSSPSDRAVTADLARSLVAAAFRAIDASKAHQDWFDNILRDAAMMVAREDPAAAAKAFPLDKTASDFLGDLPENSRSVRAFLQVCGACGMLDPYLDRLYAALDSLPPEKRAHYLVMLAENADISTFPDADKKVPDRFGPLLLKHGLPTVKAIPSRRAVLAWLGTTWGNFGNRAYAWARLDAQKGNPAARAAVDEFIREYERLREAGARGDWEREPWGYGVLCYCRGVYRQALAATNAVDMARTARDVGRCSTQNSANDQDTIELLRRTRDMGLWEVLYVLSSSIRSVNNSGVLRTAAECMAEASTHLQGVYPVSETDPMYPLYVAAEEFSRNNLERATELLTANMTVFERGADRLPLAFTAWAVDQMRVMRGEDDALLQRARDLATKLLGDESKLAPELAAAMMLVRAETFRDQQNFEAAKLEYQTIRGNPAYAKTPSGRKAMFRSVGMMIETGNASAAEPTIEYWLSQPDQEVQAQAHYFLALIAFDRKDYDECVKQLREVFAIDFTHTEARFLHGRWKLATNSEVDETEVVVGSISDRTAVRPGQQLSITVQDRNLSVAGGGSSIPVVVRSDPGGDFETVQLMPSTRDPGLFRGSVDVRLAAPVASNGVIEVTGRDVVSYEIEPSFLAARGLGRGDPKKLVVVDDARLAIGSGAPRVDERDTAAQVEALVDEGASADAGLLASSLRPGNLLHIALSDRDRSPGREKGTVSVSVTTTSGDVLENVKLEEVRPCAGVFRGTVRTGLPPPRAYASDTAVGFNAGDVINSTRKGQWKSLADSEPVKWFAVDTMGSHLVSNVVLKMKSPDNVTALRLTGTLGGDSVNLGSFPAADVKAREGLLCQVKDRRMGRDERSLRDYMESASAPRPAPATNMEVRAENGCTARISGWFTAPSDVDFVRLRIEPLAKGADAIKDLWAAVAIDGRTVMSGRGQRLAEESAPLELRIGVHRLEVFAVLCGSGDSFRIVREEADGTTGPMPLDWFDAKLHPELRDAVADMAEVVREADGFRAVFPRPVRLRTLRWDFLGRRSPDVTVDSVLVVDSDGRTILPSDSDFSDAKGNDTLEVAPGDRISVSYVDERTTRGAMRKVEKSMSSSFTDAKVGLFFEGEAEPGSGKTSLYRAYRFVPGDALVVSVFDSDLDVTDEADKVDVTVKTRSGRTATVSLVEQERAGQGEGVHTGRFLGLLKTAAAGSSVSGAIECADNDELTLEYLDRENTKPGVPTVRTATLPATRRARPLLTLFRAGTTRVPDESRLAESRLAAIRRRPGNENVGTIWREKVFAEKMDAPCSTNAVVMNIDAPILVRVSDPARAKHEGSTLVLEAESATAKVSSTMAIGAPFDGVEMRSGAETFGTALECGSFNGMVRLIVGTGDTAEAVRSAEQSEDGKPAVLPVSGTDSVTLRVKDGDETVAECRVAFAADAALDLVDSSLAAERTSAHCGERFYVKVRDSDMDATDEADTVEVEVRALKSKASRKMRLVETMPHSGVFAGSVRPVMSVQRKEGGQPEPAAQSDDSLPVVFGDEMEFRYVDATPFSSDTARALCTTGMVYAGSDGALRVFSKRFTDRDQAVLVQFRLAECLFEQAKDYRARKQHEKSSDAIARGRFILEEALKGNPGTMHAAQGEFLLANLSQELAAESGENKDEAGARRLYTEALSRFSALLAADPQGEYAARAQYHKALCLEMLGDFRQAAEEYVKMTYLYPESDLVGDATVRLATHYYKHEKRYEVAARVYENFQRRFPNHAKASRALFMSGTCFVKEADAIQAKFEEKGSYGVAQKASKLYQRAVKAFEGMAETYRSESPELRAQALYWAGDTSLKRHDWKGAYLFLKRTVLEYPETEWARRARGLLVRESERFDGME